MRIPCFDRVSGLGYPKVIIFDWDDTILPSSFIDQFKVESFDEFPQDVQRMLNEVAKSAERCLNEASKYGEVLIITNSDEGWVKYSCQRYCPALLPIAAKYKVVSARTRYERFYPGQPLCWKAAAFAHEVNELYKRKRQQRYSFRKSKSLESTDVSSSEDDSSSASSSSSETNNRKEIISFGDSMEERTAVRIVSDQLGSVSKSVMFVQSPTPKQVFGQLDMLMGHMKYIINHESTLDLEINESQANRSAEQYLKRARQVEEMIRRRELENDVDEIEACTSA